MKSRTYEIMEKAKPKDIASLIFDWSLMLLITLNVLSIVLESFASVALAYKEFFIVLPFKTEYGEEKDKQGQ